jgi:hypothetical protein
MRNQLAEGFSVSKKSELDLQAHDANENEGENELSVRDFQRRCWLTYGVMARVSLPQKQNRGLRAQTRRASGHWLGDCKPLLYTQPDCLDVRKIS